MSILNKLKASHQKINTQYLIIDLNGTVLECDNILFKVTLQTPIGDIHPFFLSIDPTENNRFTCVHLNIKDEQYICDIEIQPIDDMYCMIVLSDFSMHFNSFQSLAQKRNETAIISEITKIDNELLLEQQKFKNRFIANFSHEITSPIMSILTFSNLLKNTKLIGNQKDYSDVINTSAYHLKNMVSDILDLSKIETGNLTIENKKFSLKRLIKVIESEYNIKCLQKGITFNIKYDDVMPNYIVSDKTRIHQIIKNLLDNALKFTHDGQITIKISSIYKRARNLTFSIQVSDTGIGISEDKQPMIFNRFTKLDTVKENQNTGTGLGLTIVKELTELLNGNIEVESEVNKGTSFSIHLRVRTPLNDAKEKHDIVKKNDNELNSVKLLLVENNLNDQLSIFKILAKSKTFYLDIANSGKEAINLVKNNTYDIILMDYNMPKLNGAETSKTIKKINEELPILLITGTLITKSIFKHKGRYFKNILSKPFDEEDLLKAINECIS